MSGGSYDYLYRRLEDAAVIVLTNQHNGDDLTSRVALAAHLKRLASVMHEVEWADSGDTDPAAANKAIRDFLAPAEILKAATVNALEARALLQAELDRVATPSRSKAKRASKRRGSKSERTSST